MRRTPVVPMVLACVSAGLVASGPSRTRASELVFSPAQPRPGVMGGLLPAPSASDTGTDAVLRRVAKDARERVLGVKVGRRELEQVLVMPQRPGRSNVRWYDFDWRRFDYLDEQGSGGVRFYFYEREREIAGIAAALVRDQWEELAARFNYRPTQKVPYILYNSHREFENTNVFFVSEGVLGVTSPQDLRMALPYWGEIERFREVSTHEMVHQFTIQKILDRAQAAGVENPIQQLPLWFIEGLAEFYAKGGIDLETDMFARDMILNPRYDRGYALIPFWEDVPGAFLYTYKLGQLRLAFLAETYGERVVQGVLDQSPRLAGSRRDRSGQGLDDAGPRETFQSLLSRLCREKPDALAERFATWMRRRYLPPYLATTQEPPVFAPAELEGEPDSFTAGRDGMTILYRAVERESGRSRLMLADRRDPSNAVQVAVDGGPGIESLHPVLRSVAALHEDTLAFFARHEQADALHVVPFTRTSPPGKAEERHFELGNARRIDLAAHDLIEAGDPAFSPDGKTLAFFALDGDGLLDLWTCELATGALTRLTKDRYAERDLSWVAEAPGVYGLGTPPGGSDGATERNSPAAGRWSATGTLVFASDATATRRWNLFALDPRTGERMRLTEEAADHRTPFALGGGLVVFSTDARGKPDLHLYDASTKRMKRVTDFVTGLSGPTPGPRGLMALAFFGGQYRVFDVPTAALLDLDERPALDGSGQDARAFPSEGPPGDAAKYEPFAPGNWRLENGVAAVGTASVTQGALLFGDALGDRSAVVQFAVYGSLSLTDAAAFLTDRSRRDVWGVGAFHTFSQRRDLSAPGFGTDVLYLQREFGVSGQYVVPLDPFMRVEGRLTLQGIERSFQVPLDASGYATTTVSVADLREWRARHGGFDVESLASARFGYDTTRLRFPGGAFGGGSLLVEAGGGTLPIRAQVHGFATADAQYHLKFLGAPVLHLRAAAGVSGGSPFARQFWLSSFDNLRGFSFGDRRLLGNAYVVANADVELPLDALIRTAVFTHVKGVLALDFGGVASRAEELWGARTLAFILGANAGLGPFEIRIQWALPIWIGGLDLGSGWVPNVSLRYAYF